jgi:hypothetical protein
VFQLSGSYVNSTGYRYCTAVQKPEARAFFFLSLVLTSYECSLNSLHETSESKMFRLLLPIRDLVLKVKPEPYFAVCAILVGSEAVLPNHPVSAARES